ncbi:MAG: tRNA pseudouridine(55) synthase TruB [Candidatus Humimicrobiaceae bacterium]
MGHSGTLDPFAEGLLILLINKASKLSYCLLSKKKEYIATIKPGIKTDTWDVTGKILEEKKVEKINKKKLAGILNSMKGEYLQQVPAYSAKKRKGKHLYDYARAGIAIEEIRNNVSIYDIKLLSFNSEEFCIKIFCSAGTYIRSIANDLGERLGCGAVLSKLKRIKIGQFNVNDSVKPEELIVLNKGADSGTILNQCINYKYIVPASLLAERKKIIYVYKKYMFMLEKNSPLYGYMINISRTRKKIIDENDVLSVKIPGSAGYFLHKALIDFETGDPIKRNEKLTKFISVVIPKQNLVQADDFY